MSFYKTCPHCGANLDPGESCDCTISQVCTEARAASNGGRLALSTGGSFLSPDLRKGGLAQMVTYSELFQYTLVIIGIIGLFIAVNKKK